MSFHIFMKTALVSLLGASFFFVGCGKKPQTDSPSTPERVRLPQSEVETYLSKQDVSCELNQACPNYISKIVIVHGGAYKFCTGFMTEDNVVATSADCLPNHLKLNGINCDQDVFFLFPKTWNRPAERVGCKEVLLVSQSQVKDPLLWRDDVAFLQMDQNLSYRRTAQIVREGISDNRQFTTWMIDQQDDFSAIVKKSSCESVHNNYVNPLVSNDSSPGMVFADCPLTKGGAGAPVIDRGGKVRALLSRNMNPVLKTYLESTGLLTNGLREMVHATNFACAPTTKDNLMLDEKECLKDLTYRSVDNLRSEMLSSVRLFGEMKLSLEESLKRLSRYVQLGVKLVPAGNYQRVVVYPKCFKPLSSWLHTLNHRNIYVQDLSLPRQVFQKIIDPAGRVRGVTTEESSKETFIQFSLKSLRSQQRSSIIMWSEGQEAMHFSDISEDCSSSLL